MSHPSADDPTLDAADSDTPIPMGTEARLGRGATLGRYVVVDWIGAGGMGVVYKAYDPDLDRAVALKLLRGSGHSRQRLLREAQAMARLQHPNVITVHDVGAVGDQVFVAMELIEGEDLAVWARNERPWEEVVALFRDAGRGLAAAHDAGIVHRDFKPGNVLVGRDGRVRVLDFGLARVERAATPAPAHDTPVPDATHPPTQLGTVMGTPHYMAPEQLRGERADGRADQFAFAVALWEALLGARPFAGNSVGDLLGAIEGGEVAEPTERRGVPAALLRTVRRGLAPDPAQRFADMHAFVEALTPERRDRRRLPVIAVVAAVVLVGGGVALAVSLADRDHAVAPSCAGSSSQVAAAWSGDTRAAVQTALDRGGTLGRDTWQRLAPRLDGYAGRWVAAHTEACRSTRVRHEYSEAVLDRRNACLASRLDALGALGRALRDADADVIANAMEAADALEPPESCGEVEPLMALVAPPSSSAEAIRRVEATIARAEIARQLSRLPEAQELATSAASEAVTIGYPPLVARAETTLAGILALLYAPDTADHLYTAIAAALAGRDDRGFARATIQMIEVAGRYGGDPENAERWAKVAAAAVARVPDSADLEVQRLNTLGGVLLRASRAEAAVPYLEQAAKLHGDDTLPYATEMLSIADAFRFEEQLHKARPYAERALAIRARILGDDHPDTVDALLVVGWMDWGDDDRATARTLLERGLAACLRVAGEGSKCENDLLGALAQVEADDGNRTRAYELAARAEASSLRAGGPEGQLHMYAQRVHGLLLVDDRRFAEARTILADSIRSLAKATGDDSFEVAQTRYYLARAYAEDGDCTNGTKLFRQLLDFASRSLRPGHPLSAYPLNGLAECQLAQGDARAALATFEQVMAIRDAVESPEEEKAKTELGLSRALIATGGDRERARALARDAVAGFRAGGPGYQWHIDDAQRWLDGL